MQRRAPPVAAGELAEIDRLLRQATASGMASAASCVLLAPRGRERGAVRHAGTVGLACAGAPPTRLVSPALLDVGGLTASLVTSTLAALLVGRGRLDLAKPVGLMANTVPRLRDGPWRDIPLACLLDQTSGLPAEGPIFARLSQAHVRTLEPVRSAREAASSPAAASAQHLTPAAVRQLGGPLPAAARDQLCDALAAVVPTAPPGRTLQPSALNALALGWVLEAVLGEPLDQAFATWVTAPLQLGDAMRYFRCGAAGPWQPPRRPLGASTVAAGPVCPIRRRQLWAEPACPIAYLLGGFAGHSGLFASAQAVANLLQIYLAVIEGRSQAFNAGALQRFWTRSKQVADSPFALGWQVAARHNGMAPGRWSPRSVGQLTEAGGAAFADPAFGVVGVLLANVGAGTGPAEVRAQRWDELRRKVFDVMASEGQAGGRSPGVAPRGR